MNKHGGARKGAGRKKANADTQPRWIRLSDTDWESVKNFRNILLKLKESGDEIGDWKLYKCKTCGNVYIALSEGCLRCMRRKK